eukprot:9443205-Prorocentrum_lima.AAC.1
MALVVLFGVPFSKAATPDLQDRWSSAVDARTNDKSFDITPEIKLLGANYFATRCCYAVLPA